MSGRSIWIGLLYIVGGCIILWLVPTEIQRKYEILFIYFILFALFALFGNLYVFFLGKRKHDSYGNEEVELPERLMRYLLYYVGALLFLSFGLQLLLKALVLGFGIGTQYFPNLPAPYEELSAPRLISWLVSGLLFLLTAPALAFRSKHALIMMGIGTVVFLCGAAYDYYLLESGSYEPPVGSKLAFTGSALVIWFLMSVVLRMRGALR